MSILACPVDKAQVVQDGEKLVCTKCGRRYRIEDGIPVMLIEEAELPKQD